MSAAAGAGCFPRAEVAIAGMDEVARQQAAEFIAARRERLADGHPAAAVLAAVEEALARGGGLQAGPGRLSEAERYQVSLALTSARDLARNGDGAEGRVPLAGRVLAPLAADWDRAYEVWGAPSWRRHVAAGRPPGVLPRDLGA